MKEISKKNFQFFLQSHTFLKNFSNEQDIPLNIKKFAYYQLLEKGILDENIDISNQCTYDASNEFYSWRKSKTQKRQWSFIAG